MLKNNPKEFIKEVYVKLCGAFKVYGIPRFDHVAYREFYNFVKEFISAKPEPMQALTEEFLEARFSSHEISSQHSRKAIQLFHDVKNVILEKEERNIFWKHLLFRISVLDVSLIPK
jgi:truncated hemoglobin YjbI